MWIFTREGFFSAVNDDYCKQDELMIRARVKEDLLRLAKFLCIKKPKILTIKIADYRFRMKVKRSEWAGYCADSANNIDYSNVKGNIVDCDPKRSKSYMAVWAALYGLQQDAIRPKGKAQSL